MEGPAQLLQRNPTELLWEQQDGVKSNQITLKA